MDEENFENSNKEAIKKILQFKQSLENTLEDTNKESEFKEIVNIIYYDRLTLDTKIKDLLLTIQDVYIVEIKSGDDTIFELYTKDTNHKIAQVNIKGKIEFVDEKFDDTVTLDQLEENNADKEKIEYDKKELEELKEQEYTEESIENETNNKEDKEKDNEENENKDLIEDTEKSTEQLEEDLKLDKGDIKSCTKVITSGKYNVFRNAVPEAKHYDTIKLVYISSQDTFRFVGLRAGEKPKFIESIEQSERTMKKTISINNDGSEVEKENIKGLMKLKGNKDYDFSVKIGQYGYIELSALRKDPVTNKYISTELETTSQRPNQREIDKLMNKNKNVRINEEIDRFEKEKNEQGKNAEVDINDISDESEERRKQIELSRGERTLDENVKKYYA